MHTACRLRPRRFPKSSRALIHLLSLLLLPPLQVFDELKTMLDVVETIEGIVFAKDDQYGYVTSCPSNLGTGMRASVHVKVPNLTKDGTDKGAKDVAGPLGLSVRGTGGEHTPIGSDGTVDISPRSRLFIKEAEIIQALYKGLELLLAAEATAGANADGAEATVRGTAKVR